MENDDERLVRFQRGGNDGQIRLRPGDSLLPGLMDDVALNCLARVPRSYYGYLSCVNAKYNSLMRSEYLYGLREKLGIVEYWVYIICDIRGWEAYDIVRQKWMRLPAIPCDECFRYADKESLTVGRELLVFGRETFEFAIWKYSLRNNSWVRNEEMIYPRCLFGSGSLGSIAIIAGGTDLKGNVLRSAELYDSSRGIWESLPSMHTQRRLCSGFFMDGKFYVIGGMSSLTDSLNCGEEFDLETRKWRKIENMCPNVCKASHAPPLVAVVDNQLYAVESSTNMVMKYNKEKNIWDVLGRLPLRADTTNGWGLAFKACGEKLLVVGGERNLGSETIVVNSWCPKSEIKDGTLDWKVVGVKNHTSVFIYNCAIMGC